MAEVDVQKRTELVKELQRYLAKMQYGVSRPGNASQFALAWCLANPIVTSVILGPRTMDQLVDNLGCLDVQITPEDETFIDSLVPPGEHTGKGFQDSAYPILGRPRVG